MELCDLNLAAYIARDWTKVDRRKVLNFVDIEELPLTFQLDQIRGIMKDVTSGLAFIHSHREVHRDLKPKNSISACVGLSNGSSLQLGKRRVENC
jgi:serine/threonine protein kinase